MSGGDRYILGAFLLIADRVEHVRRLNNQGREARGRNDLRTARLRFKWAAKIMHACAKITHACAKITHACMHAHHAHHACTPCTPA